jgi:PST family polysaccharide transporter
MITLLGLNKILAIYVGPVGYAALGQFQNAMQMISTVASGAINTGVTKYTAEYDADETKQRVVWQTAGSIAMIGSIILSVLIFIFRADLARLYLSNESFAPVFGWFSVTLTLFVFNSLLLAILNGKKDIRRYIIVNIVGSLFSLLVTSLMVVQWGLMGALVGFAVYPSMVFFVTLIICVKTPWLNLNNLIGRMDKEVVKNLAKYTAMAFTTAATVPISHILIRTYLGEELGLDFAGYWEAMCRLSGAYLMLVSTTLSVYYLPRLSEIKLRAEIRRELLAGYRVIVPVVIGFSLVLYFFRFYIIEFLFSKSFLPMEELFVWQLVGDVLKIMSWMCAFVMLAKSMTLEYIIAEIIYSLVFYVTVIFLVVKFGFKGAAYAHSFSYGVYLLMTGMIVFNKTRELKDRL